MNNENLTEEQIQVELRQLEQREGLKELDVDVVNKTEQWHTFMLEAKEGKTRKTKQIRRKPTKATNEDEVTEADRQLHQRIADEVKRKLQAKGESTEGVENFEAFYEMLKGEALKLQQEYQPQLRNGIKIAVDLVNQVQKDKQDGDVDVKITIAPNAIEVKVPVEYKDSDINEAAYNLIHEHEKGNLGGGGTAVIVMMERFAARKKDGYDYVSLVPGTLHHTELVESEAAFNNLTNEKGKEKYEKELKPELKAKIKVLLAKRADALEWIAEFDGKTFESKCQQQLSQISNLDEKEDFLTNEAENVLKTVTWITPRVAREFAQQWLKVRTAQRNSRDNRNDLKPIRKAITSAPEQIKNLKNNKINKKQRKILKEYKKIILATNEEEIRRLGNQIPGQNPKKIDDLVNDYKVILPLIQTIDV